MNFAVTAQSMYDQKVLTVRSTAFDNAELTGGSAQIEEVSGNGDAASQPSSERISPGASDLN